MEREAIRSEISACCSKLMFSQNSVQLCQEAAPQQEEFLYQVFRSELEHRDCCRRARFLKKASFPVYKTLEGYDFNTIKLPSSLTRDDLLTGQFIREKRNIVMYGPVGTGKTHLATAIGVKACENGIETRFFTASEIVLKLSEFKRCGTLEKFIHDLLKAELLIIDEWGYVPIDREGAQLLFRVISDSYETRSLLITTNLEFSKWGAVFTDDQMAAAMIDRLAHHGHLILFEGESYRMKHALMKQI
jgi:DNA replication protein DnaC